MSGLKFLVFVVLTVISWGVYGPVLHAGQVALGENGSLSRWKPLICVGLAYFLIAVVYPIIVIPREGKGNWSISGMVWSFAAGAVGAIGALGIILAFMFGGTPVFVMPLVFGFAPVINTFVTALMARTIRQASPMFYLGVLVVAIGGAGIMFFKPAPAARHAAVTETSATSMVQESGSNPVVTDMPVTPVVNRPHGPAIEYWLLIGSVALTALCWGSYGPILHKGQSKMGGSRLRPFLFVGLAYLFVAVVLPVALWNWLPPDPGTINTRGVLWSLLAGAVGAGGALGIIYAFNFGGKPITIMPLVFGGAPVINTFTTVFTNPLGGRFSTPFYISLFLVIGGAVVVLVCAPRGHAAPEKRAGKDSP